MTLLLPTPAEYYVWADERERNRLIEEADRESVKRNRSTTFPDDVYLGAEIRDRGGMVFNVKHPAYGATGDGTTDDTTAINAAITDAKAVNGIVFFPTGSYAVSSALNIDGIQAWGAGIGSEVTPTGTGHAAFVMTSASQELPGTGVYNMRITEGGTNNEGVKFYTARHCRVWGCEIQDFTGTGAAIRLANDGASWTESNFVQRTRLTNNQYSIKFAHEDDDTTETSYAYNQFIDVTISSMPSTSYGVFLADQTNKCVWYGGRFTGNIYGDDSTSCLLFATHGNLRENFISVGGEAAGASAPNIPTLFKVYDSGEVQYNVFDVRYQASTLVSADAGGVMTRNSGTVEIDSTIHRFDDDASETTTNLGDASNAINTTAKYPGKRVQVRLSSAFTSIDWVRADGSATTDDWIYEDGTTPITPA